MSLLVHYTLNSASDHEAQANAMATLVVGLKGEAIEGLAYSCFATDDPCRFVGVLEFPDEAVKMAFLGSNAFAAYRETVGPLFANPPETVELAPIASTRDPVCLG
ncbi:hypothetical protein O2N63_05555 [Aliiroseovarius sp. KMU-50]|uniref:Antibiotic biosynthesis monooxygenase n=1 Tax=Aliiroseovarius salicola TaxID=3009082 RepID=A0ABT4VZ62_9RHOB|nr:hypothetical protein [Aliiroseovarius sp. KMU-50]MDA5093551.1 hypothetical protein [Aliiroseovarius sp. KMU-50]